MHLYLGIEGVARARLGGALLFNGAIMFALKVTAVQIIGTWTMHTEERIKWRDMVQSVPISVIENNTVLPALSC